MWQCNQRHVYGEEEENITVKGSKELAGGRRLHLMIAIGFVLGVILRDPYDKMNGGFFCKLSERTFQFTLWKTQTYNRSEESFCNGQ